MVGGYIQIKFSHGRIKRYKEAVALVHPNEVAQRRSVCAGAKGRSRDIRPRRRRSSWLEKSMSTEMVSPSWEDRLASLGALRTPDGFCMNNM